MEDNDKQNLDWNFIEKILNQAKTQRLEHPYSLLAPKPYHFPVGSKYPGVAITLIGPARDPQMKLLWGYGMPQVPHYIVATVSAAIYGDEFADFTVEYFGIVSEQVNIEAVRERQVGQARCKNVEPKKLPLNAGMSVTLKKDGQLINILPWRWRVYMNESSLCLENIYHRAIGWIPYVLGVTYKNPDKMLVDASRFVPGFSLGNMVDKTHSQKGRPPTFKKKKDFLAALEQAAGQLNGHSLTQPNIAALMDADERQIRLWCDKFGVDWLAWKRGRKAKPDKNRN